LPLGIQKVMQCGDCGPASQLDPCGCLCRCEVRSGPEFLLRKYVYYSTGRFHLVQFYYSDAKCREPAFSLETRGVFRQLHPSWTVRGGNDVDYETTHVAVVAYTDPVASALQRTVNNTCNSASTRKPTRTSLLGRSANSDVAPTEAYFLRL